MNKDEIRVLVKDKKFYHALIGIGADKGNIIIFHADKDSPTGCKRVGAGPFDDVFDVLHEENVPASKFKAFISFVEKVK